MAEIPRDIESILREEIDTQRSIAQNLRHEVEIQKARAAHWEALCRWAYQRSSEALMMPPSLPREARKAREQAICDINYKLGGAVR